MIDNRFSLEKFNNISLNNDLSSSLQKELEVEIANELHTALVGAIEQIAKRLNELGHRVEVVPPEFDSESSSWEYELSDSSNRDNPRVCLDTQVCVLSGYKDAGQ